MAALKSFWDQSFFLPKPVLTENNLPDQSNRVFIVTGGYTGVGNALVDILYQQNGTVYVAGRNKNKAEAAIKEIKAAHPQSKGRIEPLIVDLADLKSIKPAVDDFKSKESRLDVLTNNAGVMTPGLGSLSAQNHELQIGTNCLGSYLLTELLTPLLEKTAKMSGTPAGSVRVTWAGSAGVDVASPKNGGLVIDEAGNFVPLKNDQFNYGQSKVGNLFLSKEFARRRPFERSGIISNCWNPGNLRTELTRNSPWIMMLVLSWILYPAVYGAYTELFAGWDEAAGKPEKNGAYIHPWGRFGGYRQDIDDEITKENGNASKFWEWCDRQTKQYA